MLSTAGSRPPTSVHPSPNNALQRTAAGGRIFLVFHALSRQPLSLSLEALGPGSLPSVLRRHAGSRSSAVERVPVRPVSASVPRASRFLRTRFPGGSTHHSPAGGQSVPVQPLCRRGA